MKTMHERNHISFDASLKKIVEKMHKVYKKRNDFLNKTEYDDSEFKHFKAHLDSFVTNNKDIAIVNTPQDIAERAFSLGFK
jgi:hypothetical protein